MARSARNPACASSAGTPPPHRNRRTTVPQILARVCGVSAAILLVGVFGAGPALASEVPAEAEGATESPAIVEESTESSPEAEQTAPSELGGESVPPAAVLAELPEQGCPANNVCAYQFTRYRGERYPRPCSGSGEQLGGVYRSARNRCGNKSNLLKLGGSIIACMNHGGNRPEPGVFSSIYLWPSWGNMC